MISFLAQFCKMPSHLDLNLKRRPSYVWQGLKLGDVILFSQVLAEPFFGTCLNLNGVRSVWFLSCTFKVIRNIALDILTEHYFTPDRCAQIKKWWLFSLCSVLTREVTFYIGVGHVLSFRKININEFSSKEKEFNFGNANVVGSGNYNFLCILAII